MAGNQPHSQINWQPFPGNPTGEPHPPIHFWNLSKRLGSLFVDELVVGVVEGLDHLCCLFFHALKIQNGGPKTCYISKGISFWLSRVKQLSRGSNHKNSTNHESWTTNALPNRWRVLGCHSFGDPFLGGPALLGSEDSSFCPCSDNNGTLGGARSATTTALGPTPYFTWMTASPNPYRYITRLVTLRRYVGEHAHLSERTVWVVASWSLSTCFSFWENHSNVNTTCQWPPIILRFNVCCLNPNLLGTLITQWIPSLIDASFISCHIMSISYT